MSSLGLSFSYSTSNTNQDSHDVTTSEANRYDQHYHTAHSGNTTTTNTTNTDESDRSTTTTTTMIDRSYHVNIINSNFQPGLSATGQPAIGAPGAIQPVGPTIPQGLPLPLPIDQCPHSEAEDEGKKENNKVELNVEILFSEMSPEMEESATNFIIVAYIKKSDPMSRAKFICDSFEKQYGKSYHCVIGSDFGNFVNYLKKCYVHVKVADQRVILFKTPQITAETEIKQLQGSLDEAKLTMEAMETCNVLIEEYRDGMELACSTTKPDAFVSQKHGELQKNAIQKFEEWAKKNENLLTPKQHQDFITLQTSKYFMIYDSRNKERYAVANKPDGSGWYAASNGDFPDGAVIGCREYKDVRIIVRAHHDGHLIPGKLVPINSCCYVAHNGREHAKSSYEVLCNAKVKWVRMYPNSSAPPNALPGGYENNVGTLYIGRVRHGGPSVIGKVILSERKCYVPYNGREIQLHEYEILVKE